VSLACGRPASDPAPRLIRVGYSGEADFGDLPSLVAHERLRSQGYQVEATFFSAPDIAVEAAARGSVDVIHASIIGAWTAIGRGARIRTVMSHLANPYRLVVAPGLSSCADLDGRRLALTTDAGVSTHLVTAFIDEECPSARPEVLLITESTSRAAAFLAGSVDASALDLSSLHWLQQRAPGRFKVLSDFSTRWPGIRTTGVHVNTAWAAERPEVVREYLRAMVAANRSVMADPGLLVSAARDHLSQSEDWTTVARWYLDAHVWLEQGGLTRADVERTLDFFKAYSHLDQQLAVDAVADVSFLERALAD
jgi:ABC-type nitrate/sulfonate/bicarbonate transport system substrate-binding protein